MNKSAVDKSLAADVSDILDSGVEGEQLVQALLEARRKYKDRGNASAVVPPPSPPSPPSDT